MTAENKRQRKCIMCGKQDDKVNLYRFVRNSAGVVSFDGTGRAPGRGAYVCSPECFAAAHKKSKLDRALKVTISADTYECLAQEVAAAAREAR